MKGLKILKTNFEFSKVKQVLKNSKVISYLNILPEKYVMFPIGKAANKIAFIYEKYYVQVLLKELGFLNRTSNPYQ